MNAAQIVAAYDALRAEYDEARAEATACGYDFPSFEHWSGASSPKADAQARIGNIWDAQDRVEDN